MLIEFTVGNFRSIRDKMTLSMVADRADHRLAATNVVPINNRYSLLRTAAIYGANASGKSNFLHGIGALQHILLGSVNSRFVDFRTFTPPAQRIEPFLLNATIRGKPCVFEICFLQGEMEYRYGIEIIGEPYRIVSESLFRSKPRTEEVKLFERKNDIVSFGPSFKWEAVSRKIAYEAISPERAFLGNALQYRQIDAINVLTWVIDLEKFGDGLYADENPSAETLKQLRDNPEKLEWISNVLRSLDTGIFGVDLSDEDEESDSSGIFASLYGLSKSVTDSPVKRTIVRTIHPVYDDSGTPVEDARFRLDRQASRGTRKLFRLVERILNCLIGGKTLIIDEFDSSLHSAITRRIVEIFQNPELNPYNAQLIFATHDTNLLIRTLLRRDQIWFTEKDRHGATDLYSLAEFKQPLGSKVRNDASYEQAYLTGRYGGVPFLRDIEHLFNGNASSDSTDLKGAEGSALTHAR